MVCLAHPSPPALLTNRISTQMVFLELADIVYLPTCRYLKDIELATAHKGIELEMDSLIAILQERQSSQTVILS